MATEVLRIFPPQDLELVGLGTASYGGNGGCPVLGSSRWENCSISIVRVLLGVF